MKRRFFTRTVACSTLSTGIPFSQAFAQVIASGGQALLQNFKRLEWTLMLHRRICPIQYAESFAQVTGEKKAIWAALGYQTPFEHACFYGPNEEFCFFPVIKNHPASGSKDVLLPVFSLDGQGQWRYTHTLSGYQLDAMLRTAHALHACSPDSLQRLLLPIGKAGATDKKGSFATQEGIVETITTVIKGRISTSCKVINGSGTFYSGSFTHS